MHDKLRPSGLPVVGSLPWGSHFCQFYEEREDLMDSLVPYFKAGLEHNERCLWVTSEPFRAEDARTALRQALPDLVERERHNQIEIINHQDWYARTGKADPDVTLRGWVEREERTLAEGFSGMRLTGNAYWVERSDWKGFVDYEARVSRTFKDRHLIGLCSYCLGRCQPHDILDVVANHEFALTRRAGHWETIESAVLSMAKDELQCLNADLERRVHERTAALAHAVQARDEFLSVASHELKTPITSLQLYAQGMVRAQVKGVLSAEQLNARLGRIQEQCGRLEKLINNLLDVSRADVRAPMFQRESFDMSELVTETVERFAEEFARARCQVIVEAREAVVGCWDRMRVEQALTNLLQNAVRYAPGAPVNIRVQAEGPWGRIVVRDGGPGIAEKDHGRIFERFVQAGSQTFAGGFGLGLWIVKQMVEAHQGSVTLASRPGAGATFTLMLPLD
jgi:signal transduction histidine kinase